MKGRSVHTLEAVEQLLSETGEDLSAAEVAERTGMSRATAQRYLSHLHEVGRVEIRLRYGSGGRPEHGYRSTATGKAGTGAGQIRAGRVDTDRRQADSRLPIPRSGKASTRSRGAPVTGSRTRSPWFPTFSDRDLAKPGSASPQKQSRTLGYRP